MKLVWLAILILITGFSGESLAGEHFGSGCLAAGSTIKAPESGPGRSPAIARRVDRLPSVPPWASPLLEEFETPEVDETWMVHLDTVMSIPIAWISWAKPCSSPVDRCFSRSLPLPIVAIPLRC